MALVIGPRHQLEILVAVVGAIAVLMVHMLIGQKSSTENAFHDETVFKNVAVMRIGVIGRMDANVSLYRDIAAALPVRARRASELRRVSAQEWLGKAWKVSPTRDRLCRDRVDARRFTAPALAHARRNQMRRRFPAMAVALKEASRMARELAPLTVGAATKRDNLRWRTAAAFADARWDFVERGHIVRPAHRVAAHVVAAKETRLYRSAAPAFAEAHVRQYTPSGRG